MNTIVKVIASFISACALQVSGTQTTIQQFIESGFTPWKILPEFVISYFIIVLLERVSRLVDSRVDWIDHPYKRILIQVFLTTGVLSAVMLSLVVLQVSLLGCAALFTSGWFVHTTMSIITFVFLMNLLFVCKSLYKKLKKAEEQLHKEFPHLFHS